MSLGSTEPAPTERGFTVVELLISVTLLLLAVLLATQILLESQRLMLRSQRALVAEDADFALQRLRSDLRSADFPSLPLVALDGRWMATSLILRRGTGSVVWTLDGAALVRRELDASGEIEAERVMLQRLDSWRWRALSTSLVEVETGVVTEEPTRGPALLLQQERRQTVLETTTVRAYLRGLAGRQQW